MFTDKRPDQSMASDIPVSKVRLKDIFSTLVLGLDSPSYVLEKHYVIVRGDYLERTVVGLATAAGKRNDRNPPDAGSNLAH